MHCRIARLSCGNEDETASCHTEAMSRGRAVRIATDYELDGQGVGVRVQVEQYLSKSILEPSHTMGTVVIFPGVKRHGREADHSPPRNAEVKNTWIYSSTPQHV
jgi:hypothetical protein